ncbi:ribonuclease H-like domain-containing protein [Tanacetum coccineum]
MVPRAVLMKTGLRTLNTTRPVNTAHPKTTIYSARPMSHFSKSAQSTVKRPYQIRTTLANKNFSQKVNTTKGKFYTARPKAVNTARPNSVVVNAVRVNQVNAVKASTCWVLRPSKLNNASITFKRHNYVDALGKSKHMTGNMSYLSDFKEFDGGYVTFGGGAKGGKITSKGTLKIDKLDFEDVYFVKELKFNLFSVSQMCDKKNIVLFTNTGCFVLSPDFKLVDESQVLFKVPRKNNMYSVDMKNIVEAVNTACYVQNRVLIVKPHNKTPYELFRGRTLALTFMRPFGCHVTILNTLDYLGKFDGKSDDGFFVGYSLNSDGPKWLFDIDVLTKSMKYVPVVAGTNFNDFVGIKESICAGQSSKETGSSQDYILMPLWKDGSLFDSSSKNASNDESQPSSDAGKKDDEVTTAGSNGSQTEPDMFSFVNNATLEATHADFFGDEIEVDMSNITTTYPVPSTLKTRIHKDHSLKHVIGNVQFGVQIRRMPNEQGFISKVYERKTHEDLHTCLFSCFLSQEEPKKVIQALKTQAG